MKTQKLIELLQDEDPSGELEVNIGGSDILFVERLPGYYDGWYEVLIRNTESKFYNIIGAKITNKGEKVRIHTHSIEEALWANSDLPIEVDNDNARYLHYIEMCRKEAKDFETELGRNAKSSG